MSQLLGSPPVIYVLAGVNGAGKSSLGGALLRSQGLEYYNPDEFARSVQQMLGGSMHDANSEAWAFGVEQLKAAIRERRSFAFESTLGANTIPGLLLEAAHEGFAVIVWYCGLASPEQHIARVQARVAAGGHDIPPETIRERWQGSRSNLLKLLPYLSQLRVYDNSAEADTSTGKLPPPRLVLEVVDGQVRVPHSHDVAALGQVPDWAKPIVEFALNTCGSNG